MKIQTIETSYEEYEGCPETIRYEIILEDDEGNKQSICAVAGEPEDYSLGRDLSFVYDIEDLIRVAYEAGKRGEEYFSSHIDELEE